MRKGTAKVTARLSLPVEPELYAEYQAAAEALGMPMSTWVREWLREGVPTMRAIVEARKQGGVAPLQAYMRSVLADARSSVASFDEEHKAEGKTA